MHHKAPKPDGRGVRMGNEDGASVPAEDPVPFAPAVDQSLTPT